MFKKPWVYLSGVSNQNSHYNFICSKLINTWTAPEGFNTGIQVFNRHEKKTVPLILNNKNYVKWYICGPTVYDVSHIGHASCYVRFDILNRILKHFFDIHPVIALGVTDIDDKIIKRSNYENVDFAKWAKKHELDFFEHISRLNILPPAFILRVSEHIPEIIEFVSNIVNKGKGYTVKDGSVYFDQGSSIPESTVDAEKFKSPLKEGQKSHFDFVIWKGAKKGEPSWKSPWGEGRPGWHIECSAMASKVFGSNLDLHGGGIDLVFPHHENEEIQSCCYHNCERWVNYWLHTGELMVGDVKMSKSLKNFISISEFLKEYTADQFRMFCFTTSYKNGLHYNSDALNLAKAGCTLITNVLGLINSYAKGDWTNGNIHESSLLQELDELDKTVKCSLKNDFDTGKIFIATTKFLQNVNSKLNEKPELSGSRSPAALTAVAQYIENTFKLFGFQLEPTTLEASTNTQKMEFILDQAVKFRSEVRTIALGATEKQIKRNLLNSTDTIRSQLETIGIGIKDSKTSSSWSIIEPKQKAEESAV